MTRMIFFSLAAVAVIGTACERHPASELTGEHGAPGQVAPEVPQNPAGAAPVSAEDKHGVTSGPKYGDQKETAPAALGATPAPRGSSFFPGNK
jgi:hypothetical protein